MKKYYMLTYEGGNLQDGKETSKNFSCFQCVFVSKNKIARLREEKLVEIFNIDLEISG